jgi:hypothetical protein
LAGSGTGAGFGVGVAALVLAGSAVEEFAAGASAEVDVHAERLPATMADKAISVSFFIFTLQIVGTDFSIPK